MAGTSLNKAAEVQEYTGKIRRLKNKSELFSRSEKLPTKQSASRFLNSLKILEFPLTVTEAGRGAQLRLILYGDCCLLEIFLGQTTLRDPFFVFRQETGDSLPYSSLVRSAEVT